MKFSVTIRPWTILSSRSILDDKWLTVRADRCQTAEGLIVDPYYVIESVDWVHVVAFDEKDRVLIIRQYRHGSGTIEHEIPCGCVDRGEAPLDAMRRELLEETGCTAEAFEPLPTFCPNPPRYSNTVYPFMATGVRLVTQQKLDVTEQIEFEFVELPVLLQWIDEGKFHQPLHVSAIFIALRRRGMLRFER